MHYIFPSCTLELLLEVLLNLGLFPFILLRSLELSSLLQLSRSGQAFPFIDDRVDDLSMTILFRHPSLRRTGSFTLVGALDGRGSECTRRRRRTTDWRRSRVVQDQCPVPPNRRHDSASTASGASIWCSTGGRPGMPRAIRLRVILLILVPVDLTCTCSVSCSSWSVAHEMTFQIAD